MKIESINKIEAILHVVVWTLMLSTSMFMLNNLISRGLEINYLDFFIVPICFFVLFYCDYLILIPKLLFGEKKMLFIILNLMLCIFLTLTIRYVHKSNRQVRIENEVHLPPYVKKESAEIYLNNLNKTDNNHNREHGNSELIHFIHDFFSLLLVVIVCISVYYTKKWFVTREELQLMEKTKTEMELRNLKNQLNPHFLFNTLNNIYALVSISQDKAQQAIQDLSKLLRYVLYECNGNFVPLKQESDFIVSYVKLMRLRLNKSVDIDVDIKIDRKENLPIIQLIFISLVENAFKHGVSAETKSFIKIKLSVDDSDVICFITENSYFPKNKMNDKSGSGIGLENLKRRLELCYSNKYELSSSIEGSTYKSKLLIDTK